MNFQSELRRLLANLPKEEGDKIEEETLHFLQGNGPEWEVSDNLTFFDPKELKKHDSLEKNPGIIIIDARFLNGKVNSEVVLWGIQVLLNQFITCSANTKVTNAGFNIEIKPE